MYLITYFKYLHFNYLTTLQTNTQNSLGFSHALPAAHALQLNTQNCAWFGNEMSVYAVSFRGAFPRTRLPGALPLDPAGGLPSPDPQCPLCL